MHARILPLVWKSDLRYSKLNKNGNKEYDKERGTVRRE